MLTLSSDKDQTKNLLSRSLSLSANGPLNNQILRVCVAIAMFQCTNPPNPKAMQLTDTDVRVDSVFRRYDRVQSVTFQHPLPLCILITSLL